MGYFLSVFTYTYCCGMFSEIYFLLLLSLQQQQTIISSANP